MATCSKEAGRDTNCALAAVVVTVMEHWLLPLSCIGCQWQQSDPWFALQQRKAASKRIHRQE
jgi:hypothetical protein